MIMDFDTYLTLTTMESSGWSQKLAGFAVTHFIVPFAFINTSNIPLNIMCELKIFKFIHIIEPFNGVVDAKVVHGLIKLLSVLVLNIIVSLTIWLLSLLMWYPRMLCSK